MEQPSSQPDFGDLLRPGEDSAAARLFRRFADRLIVLARNRLDERLRGKVDAEDVLQSVFRSFFRRQAEGHWDLAEESDPWRLLVRITVRKCHRRLDEFLAARRDVRREVGPADAEQPAIDPEPTPDEAAMLADTAETVMSRLGTEVKRRIFELSLQGYGVVEISDRVGYYERGVERVRAEIRALLQKMMDEDHPP
jgi:RNA polymerase sigma-70 factor (ECF subfamily)